MKQNRDVNLCATYVIIKFIGFKKKEIVMATIIRFTKQDQGHI